MKDQIRKALALLGLTVGRVDPLEKTFRNVFQKCKEHTMIPEQIFIENLLLANHFKNIQGVVVECGVWRGGMSAGLAHVLPDRSFYLFDSFEGLPEAKSVDGQKALRWQADKSSPNYYDNCKAEMSWADEIMHSTGVKYQLVKGWFDATIPDFHFNEAIAILRLDGDWYDSTYVCLSNLFPMVAHKGLIIIDDYYAWDGCARAVHDYLSKTSSPSRIYRTKSGVPYIIKN